SGSAREDDSTPVEFDDSMGRHDTHPGRTRTPGRDPPTEGPAPVSRHRRPSDATAPVHRSRRGSGPSAAEQETPDLSQPVLDVLQAAERHQLEDQTIDAGLDLLERPLAVA